MSYQGVFSLPPSNSNKSVHHVTFGFVQDSRHREAAFENKSIKIRNNLLEASKKIDTTVLNKEVKLKFLNDNVPDGKRKRSDPSSGEKENPAKRRSNPYILSHKEKPRVGAPAQYGNELCDKPRNLHTGMQVPRLITELVTILSRSTNTWFLFV